MINASAEHEAVPVLFITDSLMELAGSERNLYETAARLDREKYAPIVMCMQGGNMVPFLRKQGIEVIDLQMSRIYSPSALEKAAFLYRFMRSRKVRIVVTYHEGSDYFGGLLAKLAGVPVLISSRRDMGYMLGGRHHFLYRLVYPLFDRIVAVSDAVKKTIAEKEKQPWHKLVTIYNGTALDRFERPVDAAAVRRSLGIDEGAPVVGMLAVFRPVKGHRNFFEAAARVVQRYPRARFLAAGWAPDQWYFDEIRWLVYRLGIEDNVIFAGGRADVPELLAAMDVSVFASDNEGFSNAVVESMAAGKAVVATDGGGTSEAVVDGVTGSLVAPGNPVSLAGAILRLLDDPAAAREMGARGRERARELFSVERMMREVEELYENTRAEKSLGFRPDREYLRRAVSQAGKLVLGSALRHGRPGGRLKGPGERGIKILAYHRVSNEEFVLPGMGIRVPNFENQAAFIAKRYAPLALEEAVALLSRGGPLPENALVVTFDDGYRDNYVNAFPILQRYGIPATIFLSIGAIENGETLWFDRVTEAFRISGEKEIDLRAKGCGRYRLDGARRRIAAANEVVIHAKQFDPPRRAAFMSAVFAALKVRPEAAGKRRLMMSWDEVRAMRARGISFGSHGMSHEILSRLSRHEMEYEIGESRRLLRERTGIDAAVFAYPNGGPGDFNRQAELLLEKHGYRTACTLIKGTNGAGSRMFSLKRVCVTEGMESNPFGRFSKTIFANALRD